jgi:hypothetical protein
MITFPVQLAPVVYENTRAVPVVEFATTTECLARASYKPREYTYDTVVRFKDGKWSVETTWNGQSVRDNYPIARGYEIANAVINWWFENYYSETVAPLPKQIAVARATWLTRAVHKLQTEVGDYEEQIAALQILASPYGLTPLEAGKPPSLKGANWATAAHRALERDIPEPERRRAVALLIEIMIGSRLGFHADRIITIEGPFRMHTTMDAKWAHATVETQGTAYRIAVLISGQSELSFMGSGEDGRLTDDEREEARTLFAIIELSQHSTDDFQPPQPGFLPEIRVHVSLGPNSGSGYHGMWSIESIRKHERLRGYTVRREGSTWIAASKL